MNNTKTRRGTRLLSLLLSLVMLLSFVPTTAFAASTPPEPGSLTKIDDYFSNYYKLDFGVQNGNWVESISSLSIDGQEYTGIAAYGTLSDGTYKLRGSNGYVELPSSLTGTADCVIKVNGYDDLTLELNFDNETVIVKTESGDDPDPTPGKSDLEGIAVAFGKEDSTYLKLTVSGADSYVETVESIQRVSADADAVEMTKTDYKISLNGDSYYLDTENNAIYFDSMQTPTIKSGDILVITNSAYEDLYVKVTIDGNTYSAEIVDEDEKPGDELTLYVRLVGSFEAAIVDQKDYDAISGATGSVTSNKNSNVEVQGALVAKGQEPDDDDWKLLNQFEIDGNKEKTYVTITGDSGMSGVYISYDSSLILSGTPKTAGTYDVSVTVTDTQGRTDTSNKLTFKVYDPDVTLEDQLVLENCVAFQDGTYRYDMEPWAIKWFKTKDESSGEVTVPKDIKAWYGSHTSGTYGELGYAVVNDTETTQTLIVPKDCNLTLVNMKVLSSVNIIVEDGGTLNLQDSSIHGTIEVKDGGTFSMNYDSYNEKFLTGASINGQLILHEGATLESSLIYSNTNNLSNGTEARTNTDPVVVVDGNVTVKGQVFIRGDEAPTGTDSDTDKSYSGQPALLVKNGTLEITDGSVLAAYGGGQSVTTSVGGDAIILDSGTITGDGKLIAIGGNGSFDDGGNAVSGTGTISTAQAYLEAGDTYLPKTGAVPGKAVAETVTVADNTESRLIDGETLGSSASVVKDNYWTGTTAPDAEFMATKYPTSTSEPVENPEYVLMNIPYDDFYKAELKNNAVKVDAVSSATLNKTRTGSLVGGSYHVNSDGSEITGVTFPVKVGEGVDLSAYTKITNDSSVEITVTNRGTTTTTKYEGADALFEAPSYSYYVLSKEPTYYKKLTVDENGKPSFGKVEGEPTALADASATLATESSYGDYQLTVTGLPKDVETVYGVVLTAKDSEDSEGSEISYGLRHLENIWRINSLAWSTGFVTTTHGNTLKSEHYKSIMGKTITSITYYTDNGIYPISVKLYVPIKFNGSVTVADADVDAGETAVTLQNFPEEFVPKYSVKGWESTAAADGKLTIPASVMPGSYTLTVSDQSGVYAPMSATFTLKTRVMPAVYNKDSSEPALEAASTSVEDLFAAYLKNITSVSVDGERYAASGRGAVTIVKADGIIDLDASASDSAIFAEKKEYTITVSATGFDDLTFTLDLTEKTTSSSTNKHSSSSTKYTVSAETAKHGEISVSAKSAAKGATVTITVDPDEGYVLDELVITDKNGKEISYKEKSGNKFTFTMPASKITIEASFAREKEEDKTIVLTIGSTLATVYGSTVVNDVAPVARNNRTMLPIRFIAEALGARVDWDQAQQKVTITRDTLVIEITLNSDVAYVNGTAVQLDSPAFAENNRTYLPLRFVAENLGAQVEWDAAVQTVTITAA